MLLRFILSIAMCVGLALPTYANSLIKPKTRTVYLHASNTIIYDQGVDEVSADNLIKAAGGLRNGMPASETLYILIVSPGGMYHVGLNIMRVLSKFPNTQLICKYCGSMAGQIFAATGLKRLVIDKSELMMHEMTIQRVTANMAKNKTIMDSLIKDSDIFNAVMYKMIGISKEEYERRIINKEWTLKGKDILKHKLADEHVNVQCDVYISRLAPDTCSK